jgi:hypothetical protein
MVYRNVDNDLLYEYGAVRSSETKITRHQILGDSNIHTVIYLSIRKFIVVLICVLLCVNRLSYRHKIVAFKLA